MHLILSEQSSSAGEAEVAYMHSAASISGFAPALTPAKPRPPFRCKQCGEPMKVTEFTPPD